MNNTKVTAPNVTTGMFVRSPYLGTGKDFYEVLAARIDGFGSGRKHLVITIDRARSYADVTSGSAFDWWFNMNAKFEVTDQTGMNHQAIKRVMA